MTIRREGGSCLSSAVHKKSQYRFKFSTDENSETLASYNDGRSLLAMFLTVLYEVEGLETEALKWDLMQYWSD